MKAIILAGGKATRLPRSASDIPKALVKVAGKPVLEHQIDLLERHGFNDIRLSLGVGAQHIIDYLDGRYEHFIEESMLGTGGAIKFASRDLREPFFVLNGDVISDINFTEFLDAYHKIGAKNMIASWFCSDVRDFGYMQLQFNGNSGDDVLITDFFEKPPRKVSGFINMGFYIMHPEIFEKHDSQVFSVEKDIFPLLAREEKLHSYIHNGLWMEMGTEERLRRVRKYFSRL